MTVFFGLVLIWSSTWIAIKTGLDYFPPFFAIGIRFCIAGPILLAIMRLRGIPIPWGRRHQPVYAAIALLSFVISFGVVYWGEQYVTSGLAAVLFATLPLFTGLVSLLIAHGERWRWLRWFGAAVSLAGIVVIHSGDLELVHPLAPLAALVILLGPMATAFSTVLSKHKSREIHPLAMAGIPITYGGVIDMGIWFAFERHRPLVWEAPGIASLAYLTLIGSVVTFAGYYWLLQYMEVGRINLVAYCTPVMALAIGFFLGGETVTVAILGGAALVISGVVLAGRRG